MIPTSCRSFLRIRASNWLWSFSTFSALGSIMNLNSSFLLEWCFYSSSPSNIMHFPFLSPFDQAVLRRNSWSSLLCPSRSSLKTFQAFLWVHQCSFVDLGLDVPRFPFCGPCLLACPPCELLFYIIGKTHMSVAMLWLNNHCLPHENPWLAFYNFGEE